MSAKRAYVLTKKDIRLMVDDLDGIDATDPERAHGLADYVLLSAMPPKVRDAYDRLINRSAWWAAS